MNTLYNLMYVKRKLIEELERIAKININTNIKVFLVAVQICIWKISYLVH